MNPLLDPSSIRRLAAQIGLQPTKQRGQNFVHDANTVRRIVSMAQVQPTDVVLEIGPGLGSLTLGLLETGATVVAVEIDDKLAQLLPQTVAERMPEASERLHIVHADALTVTELPLIPTRLVANLPYNISVPVIIHLLTTFPQWSSGLVMVQAEVADRLAADPGSKIYGVPSVKRAWFCAAERVGTVGPNVFWPVPNVDSGLVSLTRRELPVTTATREQVFGVVELAFAQRRKMLRAALAGVFGGSAAAEEALASAGIDGTQRGETLTVHDFARIAEVLTAHQ
ncbi:MAG: 16S rRNA (adenine(1518)-N(6)/adenine(1519)-N(6))-dimethyltransferase RsmA [Propionibacteriaceae bacterium]